MSIDRNLDSKDFFVESIRIDRIEIDRTSIEARIDRSIVKHRVSRFSIDGAHRSSVLIDPGDSPPAPPHRPDPDGEANTEARPEGKPHGTILIPVLTPSGRSGYLLQVTPYGDSPSRPFWNGLYP